MAVTVSNNGISGGTSNGNHNNNSNNTNRVVWLERFMFFAFGGIISIISLHSKVLNEVTTLSTISDSISVSSSSSSSSFSSWLSTLSEQGLAVTKSLYPDYPYEDHEHNEQRKRLQEQVSSDTSKSASSEERCIPTNHDLESDTTAGSDKNNDDDDDPLRMRDDRLNIVLFYADDWTANVMGKMNPHVKTPNIDKMADNGVLFTENCVVSSVCWMSRATLATGVYTSRHRQLDPHTDNMFNTHPWKETLWPRLKDAGYFTGLVGKWHAPQPQSKMQQAFDFQRFYYGFHTQKGRNGETEHITNMNRNHAIEFLKARPKDQNFFLKVSFFATHAIDGHFPSYIPMNGTREKHYPDSLGDLPTPKTATERHWEGLPRRIFRNNNEGRNRWRKRFEPDYYQDNIRDLYSLATEVDWAVGETMRELKERDEAAFNKTLFIFTTDNGNLHGEHGLAEKWYAFEESLRVPLVIQDPRMHESVRGTVEDAMTLNVDLTPTILAAAGLKPSAFMQGRDMAPLYLDRNNADDTNTNTASSRSLSSKKCTAKDNWRKQWFYEFNMGEDQENATDHKMINFIDASFAVITKEWKYVHWPVQDYEQLYHRSLDKYDEWDMMHDNITNPAETIQQTPVEVYNQMKQLFKKLKKRAQSGMKV